jgi:hypothetical protein
MIYFECDCHFCVSSSYNLEKGVSAARPWLLSGKTIYMEIPKNGSSSIKHHFIHLSNESFKQIDPSMISNYKDIIVVLRDPIKRFTSLLSHYFITTHGHLVDRSIPFNHGRKWLKSQGISQDINHSNVCKIIIDNIEKIASLYEPHHWNTQTSFLLNEDFYKSDANIRYIKMEDIYTLGVGEKRNWSESKDIFVGPEEYKKIKEMYFEDFDLYAKAFKN